MSILILVVDILILNWGKFFCFFWYKLINNFIREIKARRALRDSLERKRWYFRNCSCYDDETFSYRARAILVRGKSARVFLHSLIHAVLIRLFERISLLASYECRDVTGERGDDLWELEKERAFLEKDFRRHERNRKTLFYQIATSSN